jgi:HJR/Mrr/RecB family endonuclease
MLDNYYSSNDYSIYPELSQAILGAGSSIDILVSKNSILQNFIDESIIALADERLNKRILKSGFSKGELEIAQDQNWQVRNLKITTEHDLIIIDNNAAFVINLMVPEMPELGLKFPIFHTTSESVITSYDQYFTQLLTHSEEVIYGNIILPSLESDIRITVKDFNDNLIYQLNNQPEDVHQLEPRQFEELIEYLLKKDGFETVLTPRSRDGGKDIIAKYITPAGISFLTYVECKRYSPDRPIGVEYLRSLYGTVMSERVNLGMLVTSSRFTSEAYKFQTKTENFLELKDFMALKKWIKKIAPNIL